MRALFVMGMGVMGLGPVRPRAALSGFAAFGAFALAASLFAPAPVWAKDGRMSGGLLQETEEVLTPKPAVAGREARAAMAPAKAPTQSAPAKAPTQSAPAKAPTQSAPATKTAPSTPKLKASAAAGSKASTVAEAAMLGKRASNSRPLNDRPANKRPLNISPAAGPASEPAAAAAASSAATGPVGRCGEDEAVEGKPSAAPRAADANAPREELLQLVSAALERSQAIGAAKLLAEAASFDVEEARASGKPTAALTVNAGGVANQQDGLPNATGAQARATVMVSGPLWDNGRVAETTGWRRHLAEAARQGQIGAEEQVALQTVSLALDRNRFRLQSQIYRQYARKMGCLVDALEAIVARDRGRQSELVQAQKTTAQAELMRIQAVASLRQTELKLRRFVGDGLPPGDGMASLWLQVPDIAQVQTAAENAPEVMALRAQADAQDSFTRVIASQGKPQLNWNVAGGAAAGAGNPRNVSAGVSFSVPLFAPTLEPATNAARKRAEASRLQVAEAVLERRTRVGEVHDQAASAFDRARRVTDILRDTERVRAATLLQWQQLGRRSLFDVMGSEAEHYNLRVGYVNALADGQQSVALLSSLAGGVRAKLQ
jgi:outer membrane protein, adhesin transport system